jgi:hypothetical protein
MARSRDKLLVWFALVAYALTGVLSTEGVKLCLEPDGHVALETIAAGCGDCCPAEEDDGDGPRIEACPCVDLAIAAPDASFAKTKFLDLEFLAARPPASGRLAVEGSPGTGAALRQRPRVWSGSPAELVRTVVLRV